MAFPISRPTLCLALLFTATSALAGSAGTRTTEHTDVVPSARSCTLNNCSLASVAEGASARIRDPAVTVIPNDLGLILAGDAESSSKFAGAELTNASFTRAGVDQTNSATPWYEYWLQHPRILLQRTFEEGGKNLEKPNGGPGRFALEPRFGNGRELVGFTVRATQGNLSSAWAGVTLSPMGFDPVSAEGLTLPAWTSDGSLELAYGIGLKKLVEELHRDQTRLQRLEGYFPVSDPNTGAFNIDRVRIINIPNIVDGNSDLALVVLTLIETHGITAQQNGGGSGPPDP